MRARTYAILTSLVGMSSLLVYCKQRVEEAATLRDDEAASGARDGFEGSVADYARQCIAAVGLGPNELPDMSCLAGTEIPINFGDQTLSASTWSAFKAGSRKCNEPQWLSPADCHPYDLIQMKKVRDVEILLNCRQKYFPDEKHALEGMNAGKSKFERFVEFDAHRSNEAAARRKYEQFAFYFNDLGLIVRNATTGATCYFTQYGVDFFGGFVPSPLRTTPPTEAEFKAVFREGLTRGLNATSLSAGDKSKIEALSDDPDLAREAHRATHDYFASNGSTYSCVSCHAFGSYKWSPFITQVDAVPSFRNAVSASNHAQGKPFLPVGNALKQQMRTDGTVEIRFDGDSTCTRCHRIVSQRSGSARRCANGVDRATGVHGTYEARYASPTWGERAWMPPSHGQETEAEYNARYQQKIAALKCCCEHPTARGCQWRRFGPTTNPADFDGATWRSGVLPTASDAEQRIASTWELGNDADKTCALGGLAASASSPTPSPSSPAISEDD